MAVTFQTATLASPPNATAVASKSISSEEHQRVVTHLDQLAPGAISSSGLTTSTTAYSIGDTLGAGWAISSAARAAGEKGTLSGVALIDYADVLSAVNLYFYSTTVTFGTDNAAPSISDADSLKFLFKVALAFDDLGGVRVASAEGLGASYVCDATTLYCYATTTTAHTFFGAATDLRLVPFCIPD